MKNGKEGLSSLIIGLIFLVVNCGILGLALSGFPFVFGGIFIIFPIAGLVSAFQAFKLDGAQRIMGIVGLILAINAKKKGNTTALPTVGLVLSIITLVFAIGSTIFWIVIFAIYGLSIFAVIAEELSLLLL